MAAALLTLTPSAVEKVKNLLSVSDKPVKGIRVSVNTKGCTGHAYQFDYVEEPKPTDEMVEQDGARVYVDFAATMYIIGSVMDWQESDTKAGFSFHNPNETGRCGCGESFYVEKDALAKR